MQVAQRPPGISEPLPDAGPKNINGRQETRGLVATHNELAECFSYNRGTVHSTESKLTFLLSARIAGPVLSKCREHGGADRGSG
jgi:hypothetical protein